MFAFGDCEKWPHSQEPNAEHEADENLLSQRKVQAHKLRKRQSNDNKIHGNVGRRVGPSLNVDVGTLAPMLLPVPTFPREVNWPALKHSCYDEGDKGENANQHYNVHLLDEAIVQEDAEVE